MSKPRFFKRICDKCSKLRTHDRRVSTSICPRCQFASMGEPIRVDLTVSNEPLCTVGTGKFANRPPCQQKAVIGYRDEERSFICDQHFNELVLYERDLYERKDSLPRIEHTGAGPQTVAPGTPARTIPTMALRPKVDQKEGPLPLEMREIEEKQEKLF